MTPAEQQPAVVEAAAPAGEAEELRVRGRLARLQQNHLRRLGPAGQCLYTQSLHSPSAHETLLPRPVHQGFIEPLKTIWGLLGLISQREPGGKGLLERRGER